MAITDSIVLRATYEHYKSTPEARRTYTTLAVRALKDQVIVLYTADYDEQSVVSAREISEFLGPALQDGIIYDERFELIGTNAISGQERDKMLAEYDDN